MTQESGDVESSTPTRPDTPQSMRWLASINATVVHVAACMARGLPVLGNRWGLSLTEPAREVRRAVRAVGAPDQLVWAELGGLAAELEDPYELAEQACGRLDESGPAVVALGESLAGLKQVVRSGHADLLDELALRARPLRAQWETRGPGLLAQLARQCPGWEPPERVDVIVVHPMVGGSGWASTPHARVLMEAVLVDTIPWLPEGVRLAWLVGQVGAGAAADDSSIAPGRFPLVAQLALIPPVLAAAQHVGWTPHDASHRIAETLAAWHVPSLPERPVHELLEHWWQGVQHDRLAWPESLQRLDQLL